MINAVFFGVAFSLEPTIVAKIPVVMRPMVWDVLFFLIAFILCSNCIWLSSCAIIAASSSSEFADFNIPLEIKTWPAGVAKALIIFVSRTPIEYPL